MITVTIIRDSGQHIVQFQVCGHSGSAPHGKDIICAGVSALTQSALLGLTQYLKQTIRWQAADGLLSMELCNLPDAQTNAVLETMLLGLQEIVKLEPGMIRIVEYRR